MRPERTASGTLTIPFTVPAHAGEVNAISSEQAAHDRTKLRNNFGVVIAVDGHGTVSALTVSKDPVIRGGRGCDVSVLVLPPLDVAPFQRAYRVRIQSVTCAWTWHPVHTDSLATPWRNFSSAKLRVYSSQRHAPACLRAVAISQTNDSPRAWIP